MPKILFLTLSTYDYVGGVQTFNKYFVKSLSDNNYDWSLVSLHDDLKSNKKNIYCCNHSLFRFIFYILRLTDSNTIIIWNHISLASIYRFLKFVINSKINILIVYGTDVWGKKLPWFKENAFNQMDEIWSISNYTKNRIINLYDVNPNIIHIFPCCISIDGAPAHVNPYNGIQFNILSILRLEERKLGAIYSLVKALPYLIEQGVDVKFTIIGDGQKAKEVDDYIKNNNMESYVNLKGYVDNVRPFLEHCDIFSLINDGEGFGIVFLEAMEYKKCCISASNCGAEDVVIDGVTGFNIDKVEEIQEVLFKLSIDSNYRDTLGKRGFLHLAKNYTYEAFKTRLKCNINRVSP
jgi:glycosyltransferase involved in cell wall biosynthesis